MTIQLQPPAVASAVAAEQTVLQVPSQPEWIAPTVEFLKEKAMLCGACHAARANKLMLALHEALTNAIVHGNLELSSELKERSENAFAEALAERSIDPRYAGRLVEVRVDFDGQRCCWTFTDQGSGFDVERAVARLAQTEPEQVLPSGRGILLMRAFLDDLRFELGGRRAILTLNRPSGDEKRHSVRWSLQQPIRIAPIRDDGSVDWEAAHEAVVQNLSADGIGLLQARLTSTKRILIGIDWQGQLLYLPAEVRHCQAREGAFFELGCRFQFPTATSACGNSLNVEIGNAIENLLKQLKVHSIRQDERRSHPRAAYTARITIDRGPGQTPLTGFGRDLSKGGIAFLTSSALPLENVILTLPQLHQKALRLGARIVRCNQLMAGVYEVGAQFIDVESNGK